MNTMNITVVLTVSILLLSCEEWPVFIMMYWLSVYLFGVCLSVL